MCLRKMKIKEKGKKMIMLNLIFYFEEYIEVYYVFKDLFLFFYEI